MTDREKLVELLKQTDACLCDLCGEGAQDWVAGVIADHLIAHGVIVLPCKVGDMIYRIADPKYEQRIWEWEITVAEIYVDGVMFVDDCDNRFDEEDIGKTVFLTREEAEAALRLIDADNGEI